MVMLYVHHAEKRNPLKSWQTNVNFVDGGYAKTVQHIEGKEILLDICVRHARARTNRCIEKDFY